MIWHDGCLGFVNKLVLLSVRKTKAY